MVRAGTMSAFALLLLTAVGPAIAAVSTTGEAGMEFFELKIRPVLVDRCYRCHSAEAPKLKGSLRLDTREGIFKGGEFGSPAIVPGKADDSTLIRAIRYEDEGLQMPPKQKLG